MALSILDNGLMESETGMELKCGLMVLGMKVIGKMTKQMVLVSLFMQMETFMKDSG